MAQAGWYPDPAGTPATYRYWDGNRWSSVTTSDPSTPPPDGAAPPPPPGAQDGAGNAYGDLPPADPHGPGGYAGATAPMAPTSGGPSAGGRGKYVLLAGIVVIALVVTALAGVLGVRALGGIGTKAGEDVPADATDGAGDELVPPPDDSQSLPPGAVPPGPAECRQGAPTVFGDQSGAGRIESHGLSVPRVEGYQVDPMQSFAFTWAFDLIPQVQRVEDGWASVYGIGGVETSFGSLEETAEAVVECMTKSPLLYSGFTDRTDVSSKAIDVPGAESAWRITTEIRVDNPGITVAGDVVDVVVVDTGNKALYGLYTSVVPIEDKQRLKQQREVTTDLRAK